MTDEERDRMLDDVDKTVNQVLAGDIGKLCGFTPEQLKQIAPADLDKTTFDILMSVVGDATRTNQQKAEAINSVAGIAKMALDLARQVPV